MKKAYTILSVFFALCFNICAMTILASYILIMTKYDNLINFWVLFGTGLLFGLISIIFAIAMLVMGFVASLFIKDVFRASLGVKWAIFIAQLILNGLFVLSLMGVPYNYIYHATYLFAPFSIMYAYFGLLVTTISSFFYVTRLVDVRRVTFGGISSSVFMLLCPILDLIGMTTLVKADIGKE